MIRIQKNEEKGRNEKMDKTQKKNLLFFVRFGRPIGHPPDTTCCTGADEHTDYFRCSSEGFKGKVNKQK